MPSDAHAAAIVDHRDGVLVRLRVLPRASKTAIVGMHGDALKLRVQAPPVDGAANRAVVDHIAGRCGVSRTSVTVLMGERSRSKTVLVRGLSVDQVRRALSLEPTGG